MKTLSLITKNKIESSKISNLILEKHPFSKKIIKNDEEELFLGKFPREFYIIFNDSCYLKDDEIFSAFDKKELDILPIENPLVNTLYYRDIEVAKSIVKILLEQYPELYVFDEDEDGFKSAKDYIK